MDAAVYKVCQYEEINRLLILHVQKCRWGIFYMEIMLLAYVLEE